jgi:hypothetical protein
MAMLIFDGDENSLTLVDGKGKTAGKWQASNGPASGAPLRYIPNGDYSIMHADRRAPHTYGNETDERGFGRTPRMECMVPSGSSV